MVENSTLRRQLFIVFLRYYFGCQEKTASYFCLLKMLKSELLRCIKKFFAAGLLLRKGFGYDGNVFHIFIQEMFNFSKIKPHQNEVSKESEKIHEESFCLLKTWNDVAT